MKILNTIFVNYLAFGDDNLTNNTSVLIDELYKVQRQAK